MRQIRRLVKGAATAYKRGGFLGFIKTASAYLLKKYRLRRYQPSPLLKIEASGQRKRVF